MSHKRIEVKKEKEEEHFDKFAHTLKAIMDTPPDQRGPVSKSIMSSFQIYYEMIAAKAQSATPTR